MAPNCRGSFCPGLLSPLTPSTSHSFQAPLSLRVLHTGQQRPMGALGRPLPHPILGPTSPKKGVLDPRLLLCLGPQAMCHPYSVSTCHVPAGGRHWPMACLSLGLQNPGAELHSRTPSSAPPWPPRPGDSPTHPIQIIGFWSHGAERGWGARVCRGGEGLAAREGGGHVLDPCLALGSWELRRRGGQIGEGSASQG